MANDISSLDLPKIWSAPDNTRLISKQISVRLPVHVAAKIYALEEVYPNKSRTQIINDLLASALESIGDSMPSQKGDLIAEDWQGPNKDEHVQVFEEVGTRAKYYQLYNNYLYELERELGNDGEIRQVKPVVFNDDDPGVQEYTRK